MSPRLARIIAAIELLGGAWAVAGGLYTWATVGWRVGWPCAALVGGGALTAWAGVRLWRGKANGRRLSALVQALQLAQVVLPGLAFVTVFGPSLVVGFYRGALSIRVAVEEEAAVVFGHHNGGVRLELNLLALGLLIALRRGTRPLPAPSAAAPADAPAV